VYDLYLLALEQITSEEGDDKKGEEDEEGERRKELFLRCLLGWKISAS
jgi:hypothetical protein